MSDFLSQIADVSVTSTTRTPTRAGFGVAMIVAFAVPWSTGSRVRTFTSLASMVTAGFVAADAAYPSWGWALAAAGVVRTVGYLIPSCSRYVLYLAGS